MFRGLTLALLVFAAPASAERWRASYAITAAGITVMEAVVVFTLGTAGGQAGAPYSIETRVRSRGIAAMVFRGEGQTRAEGVWQGGTLLPRSYLSTGNWRGTPRRTRLEYASDGAMRVATLEPAQDMERTAVPAEDRRGAIDSLSAIILLTDQVRRTARCDTQARTFDGRRLVQFDVTTDPVVHVADRGLLRCVVESRALAGFATDRPLEEAMRPVRSVVVFGVAQVGAPAIPVQVEIASRWWGTIRANLNELALAN